MKKVLAVLALLFPVVALAGSQEVKIQKSLDVFQPKEVKVQDSVLTIILEELRVTDDIYKAVVAHGLCIGTVSQPGSLEGISEVRVLNKFAYQGYVFDGGVMECEELLRIPQSKIDAYLYSRTRTHKLTEESRTESAPPPAKNKWNSYQTTDQMTDKKTHLLSLQSENSAKFDFPYNVEGGSYLRLTFRKKGNELDAYFVIDKGQMLCSYSDCNFALRVDDGKVQRWTGLGTTTHDSEMMFVRDARQLESIIKRAKKIRIGINFYQSGQKVFEFDADGYPGFN